MVHFVLIIAPLELYVTLLQYTIAQYKKSNLLYRPITYSPHPGNLDCDFTNISHIYDIILLCVLNFRFFFSRNKTTNKTTKNKKLNKFSVVSNNSIFKNCIRRSNNNKKKIPEIMLRIGFLPVDMRTPIKDEFFFFLVFSLSLLLY